MEGVVKSYVAEKRFGFIDGADGKSYFFHVNGFAPPVDGDITLDGALVQFDPTPTPKGLSAKRLKLAHDQAIEWVPPGEFIASREELPKKGRVVAKAPTITVSGTKSADDLRSEIRRIALDMGANALLGLSYSKTTGASGNYRYSIHNFTGRPAVVMIARATTNMAAVEASETRCADMSAALAAGHQAYLADLAEQARKRRRAIIISVTITIGVLVGILMLVAR